MLRRALLAGIVALPAMGSAADLYRPGDWPSLVSDRTAHRVGDTLTILVYESSAATNSANTGATSGSQFGGQISAGTALNESASLGLQRESNDEGTTGRSGGMVAQISVTVDKVLPNGDLHVTGMQTMHVNGERTEIRVKGRVRPTDISASNTVLSSRLADAAIDYDGTGFVSRAARPGIITRIFNFLGFP